MKTPFWIGLLLIFALSSSCSIIITGIFSDYKKTMSASPKLLIKLEDSTSICHVVYSDSIKVLVVTGKKLKECLNSKNDVILYYWKPGCKGEFCYALDFLQQKCQEKGKDLYIIAEYYVTWRMKQDYSLNHPILGIDTKYYKTGLVSKYVSKFFTDLGIERNIYHNFIYFDKGKFIKSFLV